jgi:hypothetical protein
MSQHEQRQILAALEQAVESLKNADSILPMTAQDFNALLRQAKSTFPDVVGVQNVSEIEGGTNVGELRFKLSLLYGPINHYVRVAAAAAAAAASAQQRYARTSIRHRQF